jgi:hypothetical protein
MSNIDLSVATCKNKVQQFYDAEDIKFQVQLVDTVEDFEKYLGEKSEKWICAFVSKDNSKIIIYSPESFEKYTSHNKTEFNSVLTHEISHIYFNAIAGQHAPIWLNEGLANHIAEWKNSTNFKTDKLKPDILESNALFNKLHPFERYSISRSLVEYLLKKFKKQKVLDMIKEIRMLGFKKSFEKHICSIDEFFDMWKNNCS